MEFVKLSPQHDDIVTDISFDYYGKRFATCSTDKHIKIWTLNNSPNISDENKSSVVDTSSWTSYDIPSAHSESIWRLSWSHPEFGALLASCSEDRTVCIWEEQEVVSTKGSRDRWIKKATLSDSKRPINDVKFAPKHLGLKLAAAAADGFIRIYEAGDLFSLSFWQMQDPIHVEDVMLDANSGEDVSGNISEHGLTCLSWCDSPFESPRLAVGGYSKRAVVFVQNNGKWTQVCGRRPC
jgi:nucleoporin SEH1